MTSRGLELRADLSTVLVFSFVDFQDVPSLRNDDVVEWLVGFPEASESDSDHHVDN